LASALGDTTMVGLLDSAPDAIVVVNESGQIMTVNTQTERLFGYKREELIGRAVEVLVPDATRGVHPERRAGYMSDPRPRPMGAGMELAARRKDGSEFPAEISLSSVKTDDGWLVSAAVRDVTDRLEVQAERERLKHQAEREKLERRLQQAQGLESLGQLAGGIAHDFNNLLAVITSYSALVADELARVASTDPQWRRPLEDVEEIQHAAKRASALTHQLLAFARRDIVRPEVLRLNDVISDLEHLVARTVGPRVEVVLHLAAHLDHVIADRGHLEQVLVNLSINANEAMPDGGTLTIETCNITTDDGYDSVEEGPKVRLRVSDTGTGMRPEVLDHAFEPFYTTKSKGEAAGLGLSTVFGIVNQAGGYTRIYSEPGSGTTVSILLPATTEVGEPSPAERRPPMRIGGTETVLLVDDEPAILDVTNRILTRNGYTVIAAAGGEEALVQLSAHGAHIDLLLSDVTMPGMAGKELAERAEAVVPGIRVLFMSGYASALLGARSAVPVLLEKPFTEPQLLTKVREVLDR
jgi:PAS domain S-box-containing protein